jgi:conjugal transfer pilus assembly protein TraW
MKIKVLIVTLLLTMLSSSLFAVDLGVVGKTYPIIEKSALTEIKDAAARVDWEKVFDKKKMEKSIRDFKPKETVYLPKASRERTRLVDMSYTNPNDIRDAHGKLMYPKGYTFNPLDYVSFPNTIVVLNGADKDQVKWFKSLPNNTDIKVMLIVTAGSYYELGEELGRPAFFINSLIVQRFQLEYVPSIVQQKGNMMEVKEIDVESHKKKS